MIGTMRGYKPARRITILPHIINEVRFGADSVSRTPRYDRAACLGLPRNPGVSAGEMSGRITDLLYLASSRPAASHGDGTRSRLGAIRAVATIVSETLDYSRLF